MRLTTPSWMSCDFFLKEICLFIFGCTESLLMHVDFSSCGSWGLLSNWGVWASRYSGFSCCRAWALGHLGFSGCSSWAPSLPRVMWDISQSGTELMSPALAGRCFTTEPPGMPSRDYHSNFLKNTLPGTQWAPNRG